MTLWMTSRVSSSPCPTDSPPVFSLDSHSFDIPPGTDGSGVAQLVGGVTATDTEGDPVSYSLHSVHISDSSGPLYTVDNATGAVARIGSAARVVAGR